MLLLRWRRVEKVECPATSGSCTVALLLGAIVCWCLAVHAGRLALLHTCRRILRDLLMHPIRWGLLLLLLLLLVLRLRLGLLKKLLLLLLRRLLVMLLLLLLVLRLRLGLLKKLLLLLLRRLLVMLLLALAEKIAVAAAAAPVAGWTKTSRARRALSTVPAQRSAVAVAR